MVLVVPLNKILQLQYIHSLFLVNFYFRCGWWLYVSECMCTDMWRIHVKSENYLVDFTLDRGPWLHYSTHSVNIETSSPRKKKKKIRSVLFYFRPWLHFAGERRVWPLVCCLRVDLGSAGVQLVPAYDPLTKINFVQPHVSIADQSLLNELAPVRHKKQL